MSPTIEFGAATKIREQLEILKAEGRQEIETSASFPVNPATRMHKAMGENLVSLADRVKTELDLFDNTIDKIVK